MDQEDKKQPEKESRQLPVVAFSIIAILVSITTFLDLRVVKEDVSKLTDYIESNNLTAAVTGTGAELIQEIQDVIDKYR